MLVLLFPSQTSDPPLEAIVTQVQSITRPFKCVQIIISFNCRFKRFQARSLCFQFLEPSLTNEGCHPGDEQSCQFQGSSVEFAPNKSQVLQPLILIHCQIKLPKSHFHNIALQCKLSCLLTVCKMQPQPLCGVSPVCCALSAPVSSGGLKITSYLTALDMVISH